MNRPAPRKSSLAGSTPVTPSHNAAPPSVATVVDEAPARAATPKTRPARTTAPAQTSGETVRVGMYLAPEEFSAARAAYLADWNNGGEADTFARWVAAAIDSYAARSPKQRSGATPRGRGDERTGVTRSFNIPTETVARMRTAITADREAGRWPSDSAWCGEAIAYSVDLARGRNGGTLPTPPARLPNRLVR